MDAAMPTTSMIPAPLRCWLAAFLCAAAVAAPVPARAQVVVVANGSPITNFDIEQREKLIVSSTHKKPTRQAVVQELIDDRLKIAKAKGYGLEVSDEDVNKAFTGMASRQHLTLKQFAELLARAGIAPETIKAKIRAELTWNEMIRGKYSASLQVSEAEIAKALQTKNEQTTSVGYIYTLYPVMFVVPAGSDEAVLNAKRREAENLRGRFTDCKEGLRLSRSLRDVAVREPVNRSSSDLPEQLRDLLDKMELGHLTNPEMTAQGLQMFAVCDKKATKSDSPAEKELRAKMVNDRFERESQKFLEEIRKSAMIEYK
jgi:peptidyl-prolyl cis-trans isomerase SurA